MAAPASSTLAALLQRHRTAAGLTQEELAQRARLSARAISDLERGLKRRPHAYTVQRLVAALELAGPDRDAFEARARPPAASSARATQLAPSRHIEAITTVPSGAGGSTVHAGNADLPPLVGRAEELSLIERCLAGDGLVALMLAGEPGIGKSRLLQEAGVLAVRRGWHVLEGGCSRRGGQEPYTPLLQALERDLHPQSVAQQRSSLQGCAWLLRLLPELADGPIEPLPNWQLAPEQERRLMFRAVTQYLANVAGPAGTLLLLDDLQWTGQDALDLLSAVLQAAPRSPLRLIGGYRDSEVGGEHLLTTWLVDVRRADLGEHHLLAPLPPGDAAALLDQLLLDTPLAGASEREQILRRVGGVPFFLRSCALALCTGADAGVPWDVAQSLRQRLAALRPGTQEVLREAAVIGRVADRAVLAEITRRPRSELLAALDECCRSRLLEESSPRSYCFTHDLVRDTIYHDLTATRKASLHERVADILERMPGAAGVETLAYHYARSDAVEKTVHYLRLAADHALAQGASAAAERHYRELADHLIGLGRQTAGAAVYAKLGSFLTHSDRPERGIAALEQAVQMLINHDRRSYTALTDHGFWESAASSRAMVALIEGCASAEAQGDLYIGLATLLQYREQAKPALRLSEKAVALARRTHNANLLGQALLQQADALNHAGLSEQALVVLQEALQLAEGLGNVGLLAPTLEGLEGVHQLLGELGPASDFAERWLAIAEEVADPGMISRALSTHANVALDLGNWDQAERDLERAVETAPGLALTPFTACLRAEISMVRGDWDEASVRLDGAIADVIRTGNVRAQTWAERLLAGLDLLRGDPAASLARVETMLQREQLKDAAWMLPDLAMAMLHLGRVDEAQRVIEQAVKRAREEKVRSTLVDALRVQALIAIERQAWSESETSLAEGLYLARSTPYPYAEGRLLQAFGLLYVQRSEQDPARDQLAAALAIFRRLGASWDVAQAEQLVAALG